MSNKEKQGEFSYLQNAYSKSEILQLFSIRSIGLYIQMFDFSNLPGFRYFC